MRHPLTRLAAAVTVFFVVWTQGLPLARTLYFPFEPQKVGDDVRLQLDWLEQTLSDKTAANARAFPQGELFTWEFYGLALQNVAETTWARDDRDRAIREVRRILPRLDPLLKRQPYSRMQDHLVRGGVCWMAGQNLLRGRMIRMLGAGATASEVARFHQDSAALSRAFELSTTGVLEALPGQTWPVDSLFALQSLHVHDELYGTSYYEPAMHKWKATVDAGRGVGLMASKVSLDGRTTDVPRGCALSWSLMVLPHWNAFGAYAQKQWWQYVEKMGSCEYGFCFFREYPAGVDRASDPDSGPIVGGYGMAATAFALAAARANGDSQIAATLQRQGELFGMPLQTRAGRRYLFGAVPFFDVASVYVKTVPMPTFASRPSPFAPIPIVYSLLLGVLTLFAARSLLRSVRELNVEPSVRPSCDPLPPRSV